MKLMLRQLLTALVVLCVLCSHCSEAKPSNSMTRIQEVFRTLMGPKPMMLASRGKKSVLLVNGRGANVREEYPDGGSRGTEEGGTGREPEYWMIAEERVPMAEGRNYYWAGTGARRRR